MFLFEDVLDGWYSWLCLCVFLELFKRHVLTLVSMEEARFVRASAIWFGFFEVMYVLMYV